MKERITDVISNYLLLEGYGCNEYLYASKCPFNCSGRLIINNQSNTYVCSSCSKSGDGEDFVEAFTINKKGLL